MMDRIYFTHLNYFPLGYHISMIPEIDPTQKSKDDYVLLRKLSNLTNLVGYIPILGIITGIARIILVKREKEFMEKAPTVRHILQIRAAFEILGLGLLLAIPDLIATIGREIEIRQGAKLYPGMGDNPPLFDN